MPHGYTAAMTVARLFAALLLAGTTACVSAQYVWLDKTGHKVFSDRPPPMDVPQRSILSQPTRGTAPIVEEPAPLVPAAPPGSGASRPQARDTELEERRKQAEAADAAKRKTEEAREALIRADNCQRARQSAATMDSGVRIAQINAQGERSFMDEQTRAAESQRAQSIIATDCR